MADGIRPTRAVIDLAAIRHNIRGLKKCFATPFCAVVKADGYGHGATAVAAEALALGADYLAVAIVEEAVSLRENGFDAPILILGYTPPAQAGKIAEHNLTQTIYTQEQAEALSGVAQALGRRVRVHLKIDTGMSRLGVPPSEAQAFALAVKNLPALDVEGMFTHFASADDGDKSFALRQLADFTAALSAVRDAGLHIPIKHCANSAAAISLPQSHLDMVRLGIAMYGLRPSPETPAPFELREAMTLKTSFSMVKEVPAGTPISYGSTFVASRPSRIATLPIGYADGFSRLLSGKAEISLAGGRAPLVGRICMDQCMADVTAFPEAKEGDEAILFGQPHISIDEVAAKLATINYEIVCMVGKRVPRVHLK